LIAPLVYFRIAFGAIMFWEVLRYFHYGWIQHDYMDPLFHFTYLGFDWVRPWPGFGMVIHFAVLGVLALCILFGLFYRLSAVLFCLGFTYVFLLDQTHYLNHHYLICLLSFLLIFIPAHHARSLDALRHPRIRAAFAPAWSLWLLRAQIGLVYFFGGVAKLNGDWLHGEPMRTWLAARTDFPLIGAWFTHPLAPYLFSYGGLLLDLLFVPLILWKRSRWPVLILAVLFHVMNARLFDIGIFPWLMLSATLILFVPYSNMKGIPSESKSFTRRQSVIMAALGLWLSLQILLPLRHFLYPGDVNWTEEGHRFSWHMKLRDKTGDIEFIATDPAQDITWNILPEAYLSPDQIEVMSTHPDMILQFAHYLAASLRQEGHADIQMRVMAYVSLNGREPELLIDPDVDLAAQPRNLFAASWILPLRQPLN
jgi:hypothetical protein